MNHTRTGAAASAEPRLGALGAVLAGGASSRYGSPKALEPIQGVPLLHRVVDAVRSVVSHVVVVGDRPELRGAVDLPVLGDRRPGSGPLSGIDAALERAIELGLPGALCVACDLPFLTSALLRMIVRRGLEEPEVVVVPDSGGPRGCEPLCAWYSVGAAPAVERALRVGDRQLLSLLEAVRAYRIPVADLLPFGDPATLFMNVNTPALRDAAERVGSGAGSTANADPAEAP